MSADATGPREVPDLLAALQKAVTAARHDSRIAHPHPEPDATAEQDAHDDALMAAAVLREGVERLEAKWSGCWCETQLAPDHDPRVQDCPQHGDGSCQHMAEGITLDLRALLAQS
jgi:hypothetical protein